MSVLGASSAGESSLTYTWAATALPSGATAPTFDDNATNTAKSATTFFAAIGNYTLTATITDALGHATTSSVAVTVGQVATAVNVSPSSPTVTEGQSQQFTASAVDQFGNSLSTQPTLTWSVATDGSGGTIDGSGLYAAPAAETGFDTVSAATSDGSLSGSADVSISEPSLIAAAGDGQITLSWSVLAGATSYTLYRGTTAGGESATPLGSSLTTATFTDTGLTDGTTYYYTLVPTGSSLTFAEASATPAVPPTIAAAATATLSGDQTTASLSALGADPNGEANLVYDWSATALPDDAAEPSFSDGGDNAAKAVTATFSGAGAYTLTVSATNASGETATSSVDVTVSQTLTSVTVDGGTPTIAAGTTRQFSASALDQFGNPMTSQPSFTWSVAAGGAGGSVSASGLYTAPATSGSDTISASITGGSLSGSIAIASVMAAPAAPTGLTVTLVSANEIDLAWSASGSVDGFTIERSDNGGAFQPIDYVAAGTTTYQDTSVSDGTTYAYQVDAGDADGDSTSGSSSSLGVPLTAPDDVTADSSSATSIDLDWDSGSAGATGFAIDRSTDGTTFTQVATVSGGDSTGYTDSGLSPGAQYWYDVRATADSASSAASDSATTRTIPASPAGLTATASSPTEIDLAWTGSAGATGYLIERSGSDGDWEPIDTTTASGGDTAYTDATAAEGTGYSYRVSAYNDSGTSAPGNSASATTPLSTPIAPTGVVAVALSSTQIQVFWRNNAFNESSFRLERSTDGSTWTAVSTLDPGTTTYVDTDVSAGQTWTYRVFAVNAAGDSAAAGAPSATTPQDSSGDATPNAPGLGAQAVSDGEIDLFWDDPSDGSNLELEMQGPDDSNFKTVPVPDASAADPSLHAVTGLLPNTAYTFRLRADADGLESYSSPATATTEAAPTDNADTGVPTPANVTGTWQQAGVAGFTFDGPYNSSEYPDDSWVNPGQWDVGRFDAPYLQVTGNDPLHVLGRGGSQDAPTLDGTDHWDAAETLFSSPYGQSVRLRVFSLDGGYSAWSGPVSIPAQGPFPDAPQISAAADGSGNVLVSFSAPPNDYTFLNVYRVVGETATLIDPADTGVLTTGSVTVPAGPAGSKLFAVWDNEPDRVYSRYSNYVNGDGSAIVPAAPEGLTATPYTDSTGNGMHLLWDNTPNNEDGFALQWSADAGSDDAKTWHSLEGDDATPTTTGADETHYDDTTDHGIAAGATIYYRVGSYKGDTSNIAWAGSIYLTLPTLPTVDVRALEGTASLAGPDGDAQRDWFVFTRTGDLSAAITVPVSYIGEAIPNVDHTALQNSVAFQAGQETAVVPITEQKLAAAPGQTVKAIIGAGSSWVIGLGQAVIALATSGPAVLVPPSVEYMPTATYDPDTKAGAVKNGVYAELPHLLENEIEKTYRGHKFVYTFDPGHQSPGDPHSATIKTSNASDDFDGFSGFLVATDLRAPENIKANGSADFSNSLIVFEPFYVVAKHDPLELNKPYPTTYTDVTGLRQYIKPISVDTHESWHTDGNLNDVNLSWNANADTNPKLTRYKGYRGGAVDQAKVLTNFFSPEMAIAGAKPADYLDVLTNVVRDDFLSALDKIADAGAFHTAGDAKTPPRYIVKT